MTSRLKFWCFAALFLLVIASSAAFAQTPAAKPQPPAFTPPAPTPNDSLRSPEAGPGGRVTFRLYAPNAREVKLQAEGAESKPGATAEDVMKTMGGYPMTRGENGVWTVELGPIPPGIYRYAFVVDGVQTVDPRNPNTSESLNFVRSLYEVPGAAFMEYTPEVPHGAIASAWYPSKAAGGLRRMHVYTPPGYESGDRRYPVLYLLHGGSDTDESWPTIGRAGAILDNLIANKKAVPMIVVMPAGHVSREFQLRMDRNTMGRDKFNQDLVGDVIPWIDQSYRTLADRPHRALAGLSMGGLQTLTISLQHPELFGYVGVFSSGWFPQMREQAEKDLTEYKALNKPFQLYWVGVARLDIAKANSDTTVELLKKYGITPVTHDSEGFHAWNTWRDYLYLFAPMLFR
jgi:enterochelin esterase-like enzyme